MKKYNINTIQFSDENSIMHEFISEENYEKKMQYIVEPYLKKIVESGYFNGKENIKIYYEKFLVDNCIGNIVISHGYGESCEKYNEFIYYLVRNRYSVFIMEHRGNCRSQRLGADESQISIDKFQYYIEDFKTFVDKIVIPDSKERKLMLFAHSMGGAIGTVFLEQYPEYFKCAVLSAPMYEINNGRCPKFAAFAISEILKVFKDGNVYLPGQKPYEENDIMNATNSRARYKYYREKVIKNKLYQSGGASARWYNECYKAIKNLVKQKNSKKVKIPVFLIQAGNDTYVINEAHYKFAQYAADCQIGFVREAKHESYYEKDSIVFTVVTKILEFYKENLLL